MNKEEAKMGISIAKLAEQAGYKLTHGGPHELKLLCPNPDHKDTNASCNINTDKNLFRCLGCGKQGDVFNWVMMIERCDFKTACQKLGVADDDYKRESRPPPQTAQKAAYAPPKAKDVPEATSEPKFKPVPQYRTATHEYKSSVGKVLYKSIRYDYPDKTKEFQLCHVNELGADVFGMKGVIRVPYNYDIFTKVDTIYFVEGEKCADAMMNILRMPATTTVGGSKSWQKEYATYFADKNIIIIPDNDKAGRDYASQVATDCADVARSVKILDLFVDKKYRAKWDIADEIDEHDSPDAYATEVAHAALIERAWIRGVRVDGSTAQELSVKLAQRYRNWADGGLNLKEIFPAFSDKSLRPLVGGDMLVLNAATGAGKTALAQNISFQYSDYPIAWFSIELEETRMHERNLVLANEMEGTDVQTAVMAGTHLDTSRFDHIHIYDNALCDLEYVDRQLSLLPLKAGLPCRLFVVDYIQLMKAKGKTISMFDTITENAVGLKIMAKKHNAVAIVVSQIGRKEEANLSAAKGSGAIEESATVVIGLNHCDGMADARRVGVDKNSNGESNFSAVVEYIGRFFKFAEARQMPRAMPQTNSRSTAQRGCINDQPF